MKRATNLRAMAHSDSAAGHLSARVILSVAWCTILIAGMPALAAPQKAIEPEPLSEEIFINSLLEEKFRSANFSKQGADKCLTCHTKGTPLDGSGIFKGAHGRLDLADGPFQQLECESCHGPMGRHPRLLPDDKGIEPMVQFDPDSPVTAENQNSICLNCHSKDHQRSDWFGSAHESMGVGCTSCHTLHKDSDLVLNEQSQDKVCTSCHQERQMDAHKRSNHPLGEGQLACSSCHNPHGSLNTAMLAQATVNDTCTECHTEKRGPFLLEHAPVVENCTNCHQPHSSNEKFLLTQRPPVLCQNCHAMHRDIDFDDGQPMEFRYLAGKSCLNCHAKVHGSNRLDNYGFRR
ncbi:DmsE family decaheme c-type cytochrome [Sansalvadorimonas sp. 2012CJ34-2]|uniref:DmsE family decaheme c-type cytochrome n=1 Tax=Parendozoicomonas callyspongiae TaxID=2942213 RepID=A0ABT0PC34_9GAMM|nr:DmsE family decaheme c-type cytochrome [Sansalvadorimonas sp. 2012CJ34-2]MCL6268786.1 DmsE family decaheme c-type cytochrome [Sansalvadorimonas sp. 2012CJ34-2]